MSSGKIAGIAKESSAWLLEVYGVAECAHPLKFESASASDLAPDESCAINSNFTHEFHDVKLVAQKNTVSLPVGNLNRLSTYACRTMSRVLLAQSTNLKSARETIASCTGVGSHEKICSLPVAHEVGWSAVWRPTDPMS